MKKLYLDSIYLYPILFPANLVLTLAAANLVNLSYIEIAQATIFVCLFAGIVFGLIYLIIRDGHRSSFLGYFMGSLFWISGLHNKKSYRTIDEYDAADHILVHLEFYIWLDRKPLGLAICS